MSHSSAIDLLRQQRLLLQMEYYCEKEAFRKLTELTGLLRKVKRGDAWFPLKIGRSYYNSLNQLSVEVFRTADQEIEHNFEYGRPVMFFRQKEPSAPTAATLPRLKYFDFTATVSYVDGDRMVLTVPDNAPLLELADSAQPVGCQLSFDETSYRAMFDALDRVASATTGRLAYLRDLFYNRPPKAVAQQFATACPQLPWLNATQQEAVSSVLRAKDVAIVHGPPGTGKTTTLVEAINETLMREPQVMVCAQSNTAVDWISEKLTDRGIAVLRIGNPTRVDDKMLAFTYERRFEAHPDYSTLWAIRKAMRELRSQRRHSGESFHQKMSRLRSRATELEIRIQSDLFGQARVIASTLVGADSRLLAGLKVHTLFIDEAAQALEAASWIPIRRASRVVLAGDHCQLPPTVKSIAALKAGLGTTLMERIAQNHPEVVTMLRVQYRMNDQIMRFSSNYFYGGKVESAPQVRHRLVQGLQAHQLDRQLRGLQRRRHSHAGRDLRGIDLRTDKHRGGRADTENAGRLLRQGGPRAHPRRTDRRGNNLTLPRTGAVSAPADTPPGCLQALSQAHQREHRRRISGAGARHHTHIARALEQRRPDRLPQRPATDERSHNEGKDEAHNPGRPQHPDTASFLPQAVAIHRAAARRRVKNEAPRTT